MENQHKKLSTEPYRGTRDFYPEDMFMQNYIFSVMKSVVEQYGYTEYGASILEETALYQAKSGSEIVNEQTYSFTDRGGRNVTIRPEMTPTVARMVARKRKELPFPLRWYSIPNLFRYERPQRGRLREHWQLNADLFGVESLEADAEIIKVAYDIMKSFGAKDEHFIIRLNSRKLINFVMREYLGLEEVAAYSASKLMDRKDKMDPAAFSKQAAEILGDENAKKLSAFLGCDTIEALSEALLQTEGAKDIKSLQEITIRAGIGNVRFDPSLVRGFDYYTGMVFEVFDTNPVNGRSLFGGGRYDDLVGIFGVEKVPGVGFGMGDVTIKDYLETYGLLPKYQSSVALYVCQIKPEYASFSNELAFYLRKEKIRVAVDYTNRKIAAQIKTAEKQAVPFIICIGDEEVKTKIFKLKNLPDRTEKTVHWDDLPASLKV